MNKNNAIALLVSVALGVSTWGIIRAVNDNKRLNDGILNPHKHGQGIADEADRYSEGDNYEDITDTEYADTEHLDTEQLVVIKIADNRVPEELPDANEPDNIFPSPSDPEYRDDNLGVHEEDEEPVTTTVDDVIVHDQPIVIGDGEGQISRSSDEYAQIVEDALLASANDPEYSLVLYGKLVGLGARGVKTGHFVLSNGTEFEGKSYDAQAIQKLYNVFTSKKRK